MLGPEEQGLVTLGIRLDVGGGVTGSPVLKTCPGGKGIAPRWYCCLALLNPLIHQEELCWLQESAVLASLVLQRRTDAGTKLAEHMAWAVGGAERTSGVCCSGWKLQVLHRQAWQGERCSLPVLPAASNIKRLLLSKAVAAVSAGCVPSSSLVQSEKWRYRA